MDLATNTDIFLIVSHLGVGVGGFLTGMLVAYRVVAAERHEKPMALHLIPKAWKSDSTRGFTIIIVLISMILVLGIWGVQSQRAQVEHDQCLQAWGEEMVTASRERSGAAARLNTATSRRDRALDTVMLIAIARRGQPDRESVTLDRAIERYLSAVGTLREVEEATRASRAQYPYPRLDCEG